MKNSSVHTTVLSFLLLAVLAVTGSFTAEQIQSGFLRKKDFSISTDTVGSFMKMRIKPAKVSFDFSGFGDTGIEKKRLAGSSTLFGKQNTRMIK